MNVFHLFVCLFCLFLSATIQANNIELSYNITLLEIKSNGNKDTITHKKATLLLADSAMYITKDNQRTVYDFAKEKIYFLNLLTKTYDETSLYAEVDYRQTEFFNQLRLKKFLGKDGIENQIGSLFELESLFGIIASRDSSAYQLIEKNQKNFSQYFIQSLPIIDLSFSSISTNDHAAIFYKYLLYETHIHPKIIQNIIDKGRFPESMKYIFSNSGKVFQVQYELQGYKENTNKAELEHKYFMFGYKTNNSLVTNINKVYGFIHHNQVKVPDKQLVIQNFEKQLNKKNYISAFLTIIESTLSNNYDYSTEIDILRKKANKNPTFQKFVEALISPQNQDELSQKIEQLKKIQQKNKRIEKVYLINAFLGSYYTGLGYHDEALKSFDLVISHNPYLTTLYVDIGNIYTDTHNMRMAWKCYDIALKMNPNMSMVQEVLANKKQLKIYFPDFFMY